MQSAHSAWSYRHKHTSPVVYLHVTALQSNVTVCAWSAAGVRP